MEDTVNNMIKVEMYIGWDDHTWGLQDVFIPDDTPESDIESIASEKLLRQLDKKNIPERVSFIGKYSQKDPLGEI